MFDTQLVTFFVIAAALTVAPGADTFLVLRNVLRGGRSDGIGTTFGICSGLFVHAIFSALGLSLVLAHSATAFSSVKLVGAVYLCWLGAQSFWGAIKRKKEAVQFKKEKLELPRVSLQKSFAEGFLCNILNPKVAIFYLAFFPQFIGDADPVFAKTMLLAALHYALGILWLGLLSFVFDRARLWMTNSLVRRWLDGISGAILLGLGVRLALEER